MKRIFLAAAAALMLSACTGTGVKPFQVDQSTEVRPSSTPLATVDPYFSIWSASDNLNESTTLHWTGKEHSLVSVVTVDGVDYRVLGKEEPKYEVVLNTIKEGAWQTKCVLYKEPEGDWKNPAYDDSDWPVVDGAIGSSLGDGVNTLFEGDNKDCWVRRTFTLEEGLENDTNLYLEYSHDDILDLYINGVHIVTSENTLREDLRIALPAEAVATLHAGENVIAASLHNSRGGSLMDFGIKRILAPEDELNVAAQTSLTVLPTRTLATFRCGPVDVETIFTTPLLMDDLDLLSRPVSYITWQAKSNDGGRHDVKISFTASANIAVNTLTQKVELSEGVSDGVSYARAGTVDQNVLGRSGDNVRIDWGYVYVACPCGKGAVSVSEDQKLLCYTNDLGKVGSSARADYVMLAYDDIYSIQFFGDNLRPYWNRGGDQTITGQLSLAASQYAGIMARCTAFDASMMEDAEAAGGSRYAELCALAYRQAIAAHKLVESPEAGLLFLSKENFSNGSIGTVDVTYPSEPLFLYYSPDLAKGLLNHIFYYSESGKWTKPFAAHDVGTYPLANGQTYGGDMPVEESGNMLVLAAAIARVEGNADYAAQHWETLTTWTDYLVEFGLDPENQLCTDDFAGHFAHNANLSIKAIMGIASYAKLADALGKADVAEKYMAKAKEMAAAWKEMAADGDHYRLTFDKAGTWSQKYNLVWDRILGINIFDPSIAETEIAYYLTVQNRYGLPLDNRETYTKTDWVMWTATLASSREDFEALVAPIYLFQNETEERLPMSDWIYTDSPRHRGFQARSVVGGYFIKMLSDRYSE